MPRITHPVRAEFKEGVAFLGYNVEPESPERGDWFVLSLYFQCLTKISKDYKIFVHIDHPQGSTLGRIHGDHYPLDGLFRTHYWREGDIIQDQHRLRSELMSHPAAGYIIYLGLYLDIQGKRESSRMKVLPGFPQDGRNRVRAGILELR